ATGGGAAGDGEGADLELQDLVAVHAGDVHPGSPMIHLHSVRHVAGGEVGDLGHRGEMDDRHDVGAGVIAVKVGVGHEGELAVGGETDGGGKQLDLGAAQHGVGRRV